MLWSYFDDRDEYACMIGFHILGLCVVLASYALWMDMLCCFGMNNVMLYA